MKNIIILVLYCLSIPVLCSQDLQGAWESTQTNEEGVEIQHIAIFPAILFPKPFSKNPMENLKALGEAVFPPRTINLPTLLNMLRWNQNWLEPVVACLMNLKTVNSTWPIKFGTVLMMELQAIFSGHGLFRAESEMEKLFVAIPLAPEKP